MSQFNEDYFERGEELKCSGYTNYSWMPEATIGLAHELALQLGIKKTDTVLDFGTAKGFLVRAFRCLHYEAYGVDCSEYAISKAPDDVRPYLTHIQPGTISVDRHYDWTIAKDVLEHIPYEQLGNTLRSLSDVTTNLFVVVPLGDKKKYVVPEYEQDVTHVIREDLNWWWIGFMAAGFEVVSAKYRMPWVKENWAHYERGNGFFVLRSR